MVDQPSTVAARAPALETEAALSWSAIIAGAIAALAVSAILTLLAAGFGYSLSSAGLASRESQTAFTPALGAGAIVVQVLSAALGGYLAGRLRHPWLSAHADEAHFRDTAHGLLAWALSALVGVILAATIFTPYVDRLAASVAMIAPTPPPDPVRAAHILAQSSFFAAVGMLLAAFVAAVAGRLGGLRTEEMHGRAPSSASG